MSLRTGQGRARLTCHGRRSSVGAPANIATARALTTVKFRSVTLGYVLDRIDAGERCASRPALLCGGDGKTCAHRLSRIPYQERREPMFDQPVKTVMRRHRVVKAPPETLVIKAAKLLAKKNSGAVLVVEGDHS